MKKGSININNGVFKVDTDGKLTATKGSFTGDVIMGPGSVITWDNLPDGVSASSDIPTSPRILGRCLPAIFRRILQRLRSRRQLLRAQILGAEQLHLIQPLMLVRTQK